MNSNSEKTRGRESGSTLLTVLIAFLMISVLGVAIVSSSVLADSTSKRQISSQQAYYTAKSAANAAVSFIKTADSATIDKLVSSGASLPGTHSGMGSYSVTVAYGEDKSHLVITSIGSYGGQTSTTKAYLNSTSTAPAYPADSQANPQNNIFVVKDGGASSFNGNVTGNVQLSGDSTIQGGKCVGNLLSYGNVTLANTNSAVGAATADAAVGNTAIVATGNVTVLGCTVNGDIISGGNVIVTEGAGIINGNIYASGYVSIVGGATVNGNVYTSNLMSLDVNGNVTNSGGTIKGSVYVSGSIGQQKAPCVITVTTTGKKSGVGGDVTVANDAYLTDTCSFVSLTLGGTWYLPQNIQISKYMANGKGTNAKANQDVTAALAANPVKTVSYTPVVANQPVMPLQTPSPEQRSLTSKADWYYNSTTHGDITITSSGTILGNSNAVDDIPYPPSNWDVVYTIDASSYDIYLRINKNMVLNKNVCFKMKDTSGKHHVYIYLDTGCTSMNFDGQGYLGMDNTSLVPRLYLLGSNQTITMNYNTSFYGFIYIPNGILNITNDSVYQDSNVGISCNYKIYGNVIVGRLLSVWSAPVLYVSPDLSLPPFTGVFSGGSYTISDSTSGGTGGSGGTGSSGSAGTWSVAKWTK